MTVTTASSGATAFTIDPDTGIMTIPYKINVDSFSATGAMAWAQSGFTAPNATLYEFLINTALASWRANTGTNGLVVPEYQGTSTDPVDSSGWGDGKNTIGAIAGTGAPCDGNTICRAMPSNNFTEFDIYCCTTAFSWGIDLTLPQAGLDLASLLAHEFGHVVGVDHPSAGDATMKGVFDTGTTYKRAQFGYDYSEETRADAPNGMSCEGGTTTHCGPTYTPTGQSQPQPLGTQDLQVYWREYLDGYGWSAETAVDAYPSAGSAPAAAIGRFGDHGGKFAVVSTEATGNLSLRHTPYPLHANSTWTQSTYAYYAFDVSWRPLAPAIAAKDSGDSPLWLIARPVAQNQLDDTDCGGVQIWATTDFSWSTSPYYLGAGTGTDRICTNHAVSLTYDPLSERFLLFYLAASSSWDYGYGISQNAQLHLRTSADGENWNADSTPGITALDVPVAACHATLMATSPGDANCQVSFPLGDWTYDNSNNPTYYPFVPQFEFTVNTATENLSITNFGLNWDWSSRSTAAAATSMMGDARFWAGMMWTDSFADVAKGTAGFYTRSDWSLPTAANSWTSSGITSDHRVALVASPHTERVYAVYVNP